MVKVEARTFSSVRVMILTSWPFNLTKDTTSVTSYATFWRNKSVKTFIRFKLNKWRRLKMIFLISKVLSGAQLTKVIPMYSSSSIKTKLVESLNIILPMSITCSYPLARITMHRILVKWRLLGMKICHLMAKCNILSKVAQTL